MNNGVSPVVLQLPEVLSKILGFLSPSDLISCTRVASLWEHEARKFLLALVSTPLCCSTIVEYFGTMRRVHDIFQLATCSQEACLEILLAELHEANCLSKVTHLSTSWTPDTEWGPQFQLWKLLGNLKTLEVRPNMSSEDVRMIPRHMQLATEHFLKNCANQPVTFPGIKKLIWNIPKGPEGVWYAPLEAFLKPGGSLMFENVTSLQIRDSGYCPELSRSFVQRLLQYIPRIQSISTLNTHPHPECSVDSVSRAIVPLGVKLTNVEFTLGDNSNWEMILKKQAPTLEQLVIRGIRNIVLDEDKLRSLTIPILPRLRVFRILRDPQFSHGPCRHPEKFVPALELKFVTGHQNGVTLNYAAQFPNLHTLKVGQELKTSPFGRDGEECSWETWLQFLYETFLSRGQGPCNSVRVLDLPIPERKWTPWKLVVCGECRASNIRATGTPTSFEVETDFLSRVVTTFPNIDNMARYRYCWKNEDKLGKEVERMVRKLREWLAIGEEMGVLTGAKQSFKG